MAEEKRREKISSDKPTKKVEIEDPDEEFRKIDNNKFHESSWFEAKGFDYNGKMISIGAKHLKYHRIEIDCPDALVATRIIRAYPNGDIFDGSGIRESSADSFLPHGNGKWTFFDGSILEGEMIACRGEPRYKKRKI